MKNNISDIFSREAIEKRKGGKLHKQQDTEWYHQLEDHVNNKLLRIFNDPENINCGETLLQAINACCTHDIKLPEWVRREFLICYEQYSWLSGDADTKTPLASAFKTDPAVHKARPQKRENKKLVVGQICG